MPSEPVITVTSSGLFCPSAGVFIDPWKPVERAVVTHAHSDHAVAGCGSYLCSDDGEGVLRERVGAGASVQTLAPGRTLTLGGADLSLHPAGHILGSSQVRVRDRSSGETWVVTGDYKTAPDRTCRPFEPIACDVLITESTFGLPVYVWPEQDRVFEEINAWWRSNRAQARTSVIFAYALGKAQRVLSGLDASIGPIVVHGAVAKFNRAYARAGVALPAWGMVSDEGGPEVRGCGLVIAPPSAAGTTWLRRFSTGPAEGGVAAAFASGWMRVRGSRRRRSVDRGFVLSDHADWPGLHAAIAASGASRVGVTHGSVGPMVRWLRERGVDAFAVPTRFTGESGEDAGAEDGGADGGGPGAGDA